eukprot:scaffold2221_cov192-Isochrysis_galbana.AAC.1
MEDYIHRIGRTGAIRCVVPACCRGGWMRCMRVPPAHHRPLCSPQAAPEPLATPIPSSTVRRTRRAPIPSFLGSSSCRRAKANWLSPRHSGPGQEIRQPAEFARPGRAGGACGDCAGDLGQVRASLVGAMTCPHRSSGAAPCFTVHMRLSHRHFDAPSFRGRGGRNRGFGRHVQNSGYGRQDRNSGYGRRDNNYGRRDGQSGMGGRDTYGSRDSYERY